MEAIMGFPHFHKRHWHFGKGFGRRGPFGGGDWGDEGPGRRRQPRGDIKFALLDLIKEQPRHGYDLIKTLEERSGGFYRPSPGVVYPSLQLLEEEGSVTSEVVDGKKVYTITDAGRQQLEQRDFEPMHERGAHFGPPHQHGGRGEKGWQWRGPGMGSPQLMALQQAWMALSATVMQAARFGKPEQVEAVQAVLNKANQEIHAILANPERPKTL
jgi:DNA-binding PadR family transcriptional regulator